MTRYSSNGNVDTVRLSSMDRAMLSIAGALITLLLAATFGKVWMLSEAVALNKQTTDRHGDILGDHERRLREAERGSSPRSFAPPVFAGTVAVAETRYAGGDNR